MTFSLETIVDGLRREAEEDDIPLWEIHGITTEIFGETALAREKALEIVRLLLARGLLAGNMVANGVFEPWPDQDPDHVIGRVRRTWSTLQRDPDLVEGIVCLWLPQSKPT